MRENAPNINEISSVFLITGTTTYIVPTNSLNIRWLTITVPRDRLAVRAMAADGESAIQVRDIIQANAESCPGRMRDRPEARGERPATPPCGRQVMDAVSFGADWQWTQARGGASSVAVGDRSTLAPWPVAVARAGPPAGTEEVRIGPEKAF